MEHKASPLTWRYIGSDTDEPVDMVSNRGNKLNKRAKYVHEGQLASPSRYRVNEEVCIDKHLTLNESIKADQQ